MKNIKTLIMLTAFVATINIAYADGLFEQAPSTNDLSEVSAESFPTDTAYNAQVQQNALIQPESGEKFQSALLNLDSAQVDLRNNYLIYQDKYTQVDAQYKAVKAQRKELKANVKSLEKKIKDIENAKKKIRKTIQ